MIGQKLRHYEVLEQLGRGGMGIVYKARDSRLNRLVALKLLPPEVASEPSRVELLRREAQASAALNHPRIVTIYSVEKAEGQLFLTMEYVEGQALDKSIPKEGFPLERLLKIAIPLADALAAAHDSGIVHRDLKPANIILSKEDRPKILDFGLAQLRPGEAASLAAGGAAGADGFQPTHGLTLDGTIAGTIPYMSPEQLSGAPVDHRSDIFSLGVILYEMATGSHPYGGKTAKAAAAILNDRPDSVADVRPGLPRQLGRLVRHCLKKDPAQRMQSAKDLRNGLKDVERELTVSGVAVPTPPRPRRRLLPLLGAGLLAVAAAAILVPRFTTEAPPAKPLHLAIERVQVFPGDRGPDYYPQGVVDILGRQLALLGKVYLVGPDGPAPDVLVQADARRKGDSVYLSSRVLDTQRQAELADRVFQGSAPELLELVRQAGRAVAAALGEELDRVVDFRPLTIPTQDAAALDLYLQARAAAGSGSASGDPQAVHELLRQALDRDAGFSWARLLAGQTYLGELRATQSTELAALAEESCRAAAAADPALGPAYACLGDVHLWRGEALEAIEAYRRAIQLDPSNLTPQDALRDAFLDLGLPASAEKTWKDLIDGNPDFWAVYYSLGTYYQDSHRYEEALVQYTRALELAPQNPDVYSYLGTVYFYLGRFEEATVALQRSIDIRPSWDAYYDLGGIYYSLRRFEAAVAAFESSARLADSIYQSSHSYGRLGWASHWASGRREEARRHLERAIELTRRQLELEPDDSDTLILAALYQALLGDRDESLRCLSQAIDLRPNDAHYFYLAGLAQNHLGDTEASLDWLRRAVEGGYSTAEIRTSIDLENLHPDPRFQRLLRDADESQP